MSTNYTTHRREDTIKMPKPQHQRKEAESALADHVTGVEIAISRGNVQHMCKACLHCGILNHFARVCNKRQSPRNSPSSSPKRPQSPRNGPFRNYKSSNVNRLESEVDQAMVIRNLQEQLNHIQMQQQKQVNTHRLRTTPVFKMPNDNGVDYPPPFFISRNEPRTPQASVKMLQTETVEVCQLSERKIRTYLVSMDIQI